ncbi:PEP-CTERM sorting domain-containing protein [Sedimentisphaera salicampi]|uniref:PEP-CTERM sorting domain-containing protein n=1 Tax=Sedimentisphaera salicampi TaxID=1941349 RepID=UPI000B9A430B|nr:PEP-CTERM sorting domain-containing protein [Sedimentisphaera salicampi]OXU15189.1 hypothetical protein SMSP1_01121 [Sedimentisphaera salicampi]
MRSVKLFLFLVLILGIFSVSSVAAFRQFSVVDLNFPSGDMERKAQEGRLDGYNSIAEEVEANGELARAEASAQWDIAPSSGKIEFTTSSVYAGWESSGVGLDTCYSAANYDTFSIEAGNSGLSEGASAQIGVRLDITAAASSEALKAETGLTEFNYCLYRRNPEPGYLGYTYGDKLFDAKFKVSSYGFTEQAEVQGTQVLDNYTEYGNGQGSEYETYSFDIILDVIVGEDVELMMGIADSLDGDVYEYESDTYDNGTSQKIGNAQTDYQTAGSTEMQWSFYEAEGSEGIAIDSASGYGTIVPEPASISLFAMLSAGLIRRRSKA